MPPFGSMQGRFGGRSVPKRVEYIADTLGTGTTTTNQQVTIPAHFDGDLILVTCGSTTSTVPTLPTGWTNAILAVNTGSTQVRPVRMFYIISDGTLTTLDITTVTTVGLRASGCMIFRNAVSVGAAAAYTSTVVDALTRPFSALALQNTDGTSIVVGATYTQLITSIVAGSVPMTLGTIAGTTAIFARSDNVEAFAATNWNASTSAARISATVEVRGPILSKVFSALDSNKTLVYDNDVSSWGNPAAFVQITETSAINRPVYDATTDLVTFSSGPPLRFLNQNALPFNIATNGGFTSVFHLRFTSAPANLERVFEMGSGAPNNTLLAYRLSNTANAMAIYATNLTSVVIANVATSSNVIVQNQLAVWAIRYRAYDLSVAIFKNDVIVASGTASALLTDRNVGEMRIGRSYSGWATPVNLNGSIQGIFFFDRSLANEEITNLSIDRFGANFGAVRAFSLNKLFTTYGGPVVRVRRSSDSLEQAFWADTLTSTLSSSALSKRWSDLDGSSRTLTGSDVASWGSPIAFVGSGTTAPAYIAADDVVRFTRTNAEYLNAGSRTLAISTNGGFTAIVMARFTNPGTFERLFDFGSGAPNDNVIFCRVGTTNQLAFDICNGTSFVMSLITAGSVIVLNELAIFAVRYRKSDNTATMYKNNEIIATQTGVVAIQDRTVTNTYIGRSGTATDAYFSGEIRGAWFSDYALTDTQMLNVVQSKFGMPGVTGPEYDAFIGSGTGYISQLFDQTGQGYHATQATTASQPWIVKETSWTSTPTMRCGGVGYLGYDCATNAVVNTDYTIIATTSRASPFSGNYFLAGTSATTNQNLVIGYTNSGANVFRVNHFGAPDYSGFIPAYTVPLAETFTVRHSSTFAKNIYRNGAFVASNVSTVALAAYAGAQIGRFSTQSYYGDISSIVMFDSYLSDRRRQIVEADLAGLLGSPATYAPLDIISTGAKATCVAAYSLRQASSSYTGAIVRLRRPSDSVEADFTAAQFDSGAVATWAGAETPTVVTLMDQSGGGNHLTQSTVANQPSLLVSDRAVRFDQTTVSKTLSRTWNVFGASTLAQMHMVSATRENSRGNNKLFEFTQTGGTRFALHPPWSDGIWYWDIGNTVGATGRASGATSVVGAKTIFSGYKDPTTSLTGYRLNGGTTYTSTGGTSTMTTTGIILGGTQPDDATSPSHDLYEWLIFSAKLQVPDEIALEIDLQRF